jgi:hypothetical protein
VLKGDERVEYLRVRRRTVRTPEGTVARIELPLKQCHPFGRHLQIEVAKSSKS